MVKLGFGLVAVLGLCVAACGDDTSGSGGAGGQGATTGTGGTGGENPCFPDTCTAPSSSTTGTGGNGHGGSGGAAACPEEVACGDQGLACDPTATFCKSFAGGVPGSGTTYSCVPFGDCEPDDCTCLEALVPGAFSCEPGGADCLTIVSGAGA